MDSSREMFFFLHPAEADGLGGGVDWSINIPGNCRQTHTRGIQVDIHNGIDTGPRVVSLVVVVGHGGPAKDLWLVHNES